MSEDFWYHDKAKFEAALAEHGSASRAGEVLGVGEATMRRWRRIHGISPARSRKAPPAIPGSPVTAEERLEAEVKELRSIVRQQRAQDVLDEKVLEEIRKHVSAKPVRYKPAPRDRRSKQTAHTHFLQWSDLHASEVVDYDQMNGLNAYDWDVMLARHERLRHAMVSFRDNRPYQVEELVIATLGDMLTGDIHDELRITNEKVVLEATFQLAQDMGDWIEALIPEYPRIRIRGTFGNHGRLSQKPSFKNAFNNWDWLFMKTLQLRLSKYESVDFEVSKAAQVPVDVYDKRILLWHGDGVKSTMVDVPWGGIIRFCKKLSDTWRLQRQPIDHFAIGHWHEANQIRAGWILMNGSVKGPDEYSLARFGGGQPAQQVLAAFHPRRGLTETCLLDLA